MDRKTLSEPPRPLPVSVAWMILAWVAVYEMARIAAALEKLATQ